MYEKLIVCFQKLNEIDKGEQEAIKAIKIAKEHKKENQMLELTMLLCEVLIAKNRNSRAFNYC